MQSENYLKQFSLRNEEKRKDNKIEFAGEFVELNTFQLVIIN